MNCPGTADSAARRLFAAAVLIALLLRLPGLDYGLPQQLKADEFDLPAAALKLLQTRSPVFGPALLYPPAPVYIYAALIPPYLGGAWLVQGRPPLAEFKQQFMLDPGGLWLYLRLWSVAMHLLVLWLVYRTGARLFTPLAGAWAALLLTLSLHQVQMATATRHWIFTYAVLAGMLYCGARLRDGWRWYAAGGLLAGLGFGLNFFAGSFFVVVLLNHAWLHWGERPRPPRRWLAAAGLALALTCLLFWSLHPYPYSFSGRIVQASVQANYVFSAGDIAGRWLEKTGQFTALLLTYDYHIFYPALAGMLILIWRRAWWPLLALGYGWFYFGFAVGFMHEIQPRYQSYTTIAWSLFAGYALTCLPQLRSAGLRRLAGVTVALLLAAAALHGGRWTWLLTRGDTRLQLDRWVTATIPAGGRLVVEVPTYNLIPAAVYPDTASLRLLTERGYYPKLRAYYANLATLPAERYPVPAYFMYEVIFGARKDYPLLLEELQPQWLILGEPLAGGDATPVLDRFTLAHTLAPADRPEWCLTGDGHEDNSLTALWRVRQLGPWIDCYRR